MDDKLKAKLWMLTGTPGSEFTEIMNELEKLDIGPGVIECWVRDLIVSQNHIEYLESELQRRDVKDGYFY